ncbi:MAG: hypothetical protein WCT35_09210 [Sideroxydans sp.]|jgi:hypothetical protein
MSSKILNTVMGMSLLALASTNAAYAELLWLTETAPPKSSATQVADHAAHHHAMHTPTAAVSSTVVTDSGKHDHTGMIVLDETPGKDHRPSKQVWLRRGDDIKKSPFAALDGGVAYLTLIDQAGKKSVVEAGQENGLFTLKAEMPEVGFYETYLEQRSVKEGRLLVELPKIELLWASCQPKEIDEEAVAKPIINDALALELVRIHKEDEGCMNRLVSGDVVNFQVLSYGKPIAGFPVSMVTQEGWRNTQPSDASGTVAFTMIREYFPNWLEFKKYHTDVFLVSAVMDKQEAGALNGQPYISVRYEATLPGKYRPSPHDYRSYAWGLGISFFVIVFGGLAVYLYRRRRLKPYKEERVDDKS